MPEEVITADHSTTHNIFLFLSHLACTHVEKWVLYDILHEGFGSDTGLSFTTLL
jgi:hypothetical protein